MIFLSIAHRISAKLTNPRVIMAALLSVLTISSLIYLPYTWKKSKNETSRNALKIARTAKAGILEGALNKLHGIPSDVNEPPYADIKTSLSTVIKVNSDVKSAFIYTRRANKLYLMVGSQKDSSKDPFEAIKGLKERGTIYAQPFIDGKELITKTQTVGGKEWISVLIPFKQNKSDRIFAVLSINYKASTWYRYAYYYTVQACLIILALFFFILAFYKVLSRAGELKKAKEAAEIASVEKGQFLANMSHEIRTPINGVIGFLQLLKTTELNETQKDYVKEGISSSQVLLSLVNDILDFSKIEARKLSIEKIKFNLRNVVEETISLFSPAANEKGLLFRPLIRQNIPEEVIGDPSRLRQILNNLISNALKFTKNGEVIVILEMVGKEDNTATVCLRVSDTGIGMNEEQLGRLFRPFTQADNSTTRKYGGTGLGLAISKQLVEMMDGRIEVKSKHGEGSEFIITFKFEIACMKVGYESNLENAAAGEWTANTDNDDGKGNTDKSDANIINKPEKPVAKLRILLAEDNATNRKVVVSMLKNRGFKCDIAENGNEAYQACLKNNYDVVFMDCQMPVLDGYEATRRIRKSEAGSRHAVIIAMTANAMEGDKQKCLEAGMDDYMSKPIDFEIMFEMLRGIMAQTHIRARLKGFIKDCMDVFITDTGLPKDTAIEIFDEYLSSVPNLLGEIEEALENNWFDAVKGASHQLKGASGNLKINEVYDLALKLERCAAEHNKNSCEETFFQIKKLFKGLEEESGNS